MAWVLDTELNCTTICCYSLSLSTRAFLIALDVLRIWSINSVLWMQHKFYNRTKLVLVWNSFGCHGNNTTVFTVSWFKKKSFLYIHYRDYITTEIRNKIYYDTCTSFTSKPLGLQSQLYSFLHTLSLSLFPDYRGHKTGLRQFLSLHWNCSLQHELFHQQWRQQVDCLL